jgi:RNA polymerase sigma factor (sigma-70 family)
MEPARTEFEHLLQQARAGNDDAARCLCAAHSEKLRRVIRRYLDPRLRRQFESDDFLQLVWGSFFTRLNDREMPRSPVELERYLCAVARNKVIDTGRQQLHTQKHAAMKQKSWSKEAAQAACSHEPTPSQVAIADERWKEIRAAVPPLQQEMLDMLRQGHTHREIAQRFDIHPKVVQRMLHCLLEGFQW